jgi:hypothetical protein
MRRLFIVAFALMSFVANSAAEERGPLTHADICQSKADACKNACGPVFVSCMHECADAKDACLANTGGKVDVRGVPKTGAGPKETKDIPPVGNGKSASTKAGAATGATIGTSGSESTPPAVASSSVQGSGAPKTIQQQRNLRQN